MLQDFRSSWGLPTFVKPCRPLALSHTANRATQARSLRIRDECRSRLGDVGRPWRDSKRTHHLLVSLVGYLKMVMRLAKSLKIQSSMCDTLLLELQSTSARRLLCGGAGCGVRGVRSCTSDTSARRRWPRTSKAQHFGPETCIMFHQARNGGLTGISLLVLPTRSKVQACA